MIVRRLINKEEYTHLDDKKQIVAKNKDLSLCIETRRLVENSLESYRLNHEILDNSRLDSLFVFPNDNVENRAKHWGLSMAPTPKDFAECYLLTLCVDEDVIWHDAVFYEDIYYIKKGQKYFVKNRDLSEEELHESYWQGCSTLAPITIEAMIKSAQIIKIEKCYITHTTFYIIKETSLD